ncbi:MAG TPA: OmpA family protein [Kofleriaceae bacterium]|nr:OmpA family protein [Kofleriaceae bacterium]
MKLFPMLFVLAIAAAPAAAEPQDLSQHPRVGELCEIDFASDSVALPEDAPNKLGLAAGWAVQNPGGLLVIDGHADRTGSSPYNVRLSLARAEVVRDQLVAAGVDPDRIVIAAFGYDAPQRPVAAENRRVTIWSTHDPLSDVTERLDQLHADEVSEQP